MIKTFTTTTIPDIISKHSAEIENTNRELLQPLMNRKKALEDLQGTVKDSRIRALQQLVTDMKNIERLYKEFQESIDEANNLLHAIQNSNNSAQNEKAMQNIVNNSIETMRTDLQMRNDKYKQEMLELIQVLGKTAV